VIYFDQNNLDKNENLFINFHSFTNKIVQNFFKSPDFFVFFKNFEIKNLLNHKINYSFEWITHPFLMVERTWMPFILGNFVFFLLFNLVAFFHKGIFLFPKFKFFLPLLFLIIFLWIYSICVDSLFLKNRHTREVQLNYLTGVSLFILSEIMIFFWIFLSIFSLCIKS